MNLIPLLEQTKLFGGLSDGSKKTLAKICIAKSFRKKEHLFFEGATGSSIYLLTSGSVQLYKMTAAGKQAVIKMVSPGELFAEVILFEQDTYPVNAVALKSSAVFMIPKSKFYELLGQEKFRNDFLCSLMKKLRYMAGRILALSSQDVETRFFNFLAEHGGRKPVYPVSWSKQDVASAIGTNPETLSRLLLRLKRKKKVVWEKKVIRVDPESWDLYSF